MKLISFVLRRRRRSRSSSTSRSSSGVSSQWNYPGSPQIRARNRNRARAQLNVHFRQSNCASCLELPNPILPVHCCPVPIRTPSYF